MASKASKPSTPSKIAPTDVRFFATPAAWRRWLETHHATRDEQWVGFHKTHTKKASITWPESVDEALCFGWIDAVRKGIDDETYAIRFTRRKPSSIWSAINIRRMGELEAAGRVTAAGRAAFAARRDGKSRVYSYEQERAHTLPDAWQRELDKNRPARTYLEAQPPWYRKVAVHYVMSAKQEPTRRRRFELLVEHCAAGTSIPPLRYRERKKG